jgi:hypothetical protein
LREQEELAKLRTLDSDAVMEILRVPPGRIVGEAQSS